MNIFAQFSGTFLHGARKVSYKSLAVRSIQVKTIKNHSLGLYVGCPRPLNTGVRLIEVEFTVFYWVKFRDFDNCPLNRGCPLDTRPLNTGLTVYVSGNWWLALHVTTYIAVKQVQFIHRKPYLPAAAKNNKGCYFWDSQPGWTYISQKLTYDPLFSSFYPFTVWTKYQALKCYIYFSYLMAKYKQSSWKHNTSEVSVIYQAWRTVVDPLWWLKYLTWT